MQKQLVNLTPHTLNLYTDAGVVELPTSGTIARARNSSVPGGNAGGIPIYVHTFADVEGLPDPVDGKVYVTSALVLKALRAAGIQRTDVVAPGTGPNDGAVRDERGRVSGVTRLVREA